MNVMMTSVRIPKPLLEAVDRKARALKMSRDRLIVQALKRELAPGADWSPGSFEQLRTVDSETAARGGRASAFGATSLNVEAQEILWHLFSHPIPLRT